MHTHVLYTLRHVLSKHVDWVCVSVNVNKCTCARHLNVSVKYACVCWVYECVCWSVHVLVTA